MADSENVELSKKATIVRQTDAEKKVVEAQSKKEGTEEVNIWRRAMKEYLERRNVEMPEGLFQDRKPGNRLPKSAALNLQASRAVA